MAILKFDDKSYTTIIDYNEEIIQRIDKKIKRIDKLIKCYKWKKGIKKR